MDGFLTYYFTVATLIGAWAAFHYYLKTGEHVWPLWQLALFMLLWPISVGYGLYLEISDYMNDK